jgi:hypothetical protein
MSFAAKRQGQAKARRACFETNRKADADGELYLDCYICGLPIYPAREAWEADHPIAHALGGTELRPAHVKCHRVKTTTQDVPAIAKSKRVFDKHYGIKKKGWHS